MNQQTLEFSDFQQRVLELPEECDVFLGGGRGGGKSFTIALLILRAVEQYGERARILYIRKSYSGLRDFENLTREIFGMVYGTAAKYNQSEHIWRFPSAGYLELAQLETPSDYQKFQGRSFTMLCADEIGQYAQPDLLDILRSNLRGPKDIPVRVIFAGNPGGPGHFWVAKRYVFAGAGPWKAFIEPKSKRHWVYAPSTYHGNKFIDREQYRNQLESACVDDNELLSAWIDGNWAIARGAYFASVLDESRNAVDNWTAIPETWDTWLAHDFGSSAPSVTFVCAQSPGDYHEGRFYPRNSIVLVDELAAVQRDNLNMGLNWTASTTAEAIVELCQHWGIKARGVADDAIFAKSGYSSGSIAEEFSRKSVYFQPARKSDRITGWNLMRRLLADAGKPDVPGLYISRACTYFWDTVPYLARDQKRVEDLDSTGPDHGADACRYGLMRLKRHASTGPLQI